MSHFTKGLILAGCAVPYGFLALWWDLNHIGTPVWWYGYGVLLAGALVLGWALCRQQSLKLALMGNGLSALTSLLCALLFQTHTTRWAFQTSWLPSRVLLLTGLMCLLQCFAVFMCKPFRYDQK